MPGFLYRLEAPCGPVDKPGLFPAREIRQWHNNTFAAAGKGDVAFRQALHIGKYHRGYGGRLA